MPIGQTAFVLPDLTTADGRAELERAVAVVRSIGQPDPVRRVATLRSLLDAELATAALSQAEFRDRAATKFGPDAQQMYFTADGLEQATRRELADHRAARFAAAGVGDVLDLCCGIGADALAFARAGLSVRGIDTDPATVAVAIANTHAADVHGEVLVEQGEAETADRAAAGSVFLDPARRTDRGRTFDPSAYSPSFSFVREVVTGTTFAAAKLAPGLDHALIPSGVEAEWVSFAGAVKEAVLWSSGFVQAGVTRRASLLPAAVELTDADPVEPRVGGVGGYLYEPDGAVIRAGLVQQVAARLPGGRRIDQHLAYLSADKEVNTPLAKGYLVIGVLPYSVKRLRAELHRRQVGIVEIKKRGVDIDPAQLRRELKPSGPNSLTVLLARVGDERLAILAHPIATGRR
ncbi:MAG TPA: class I SAM-dependent methyltransferase [Jatrophihabitans sp.]|jgi:SAM-dependent methyltransferase